MGRRELLRRIGLFSDLADHECDAILALVREKTVTRGATVFHQNESGGCLYLILSGEVKVTRTGRQGREVTVAVLRDGNFFGEMSLLDGQARSASVVALRATRLLVLERGHFQRHVLTNAGVVGKLLRELSKRLRAADQAVENLSLAPVRERIVHLLGHLGRRTPLRDGAGLIERAPTHQEIAEMVGASRETVTRTLAALQEEGLIQVLRRKIALRPAFFEAQDREQP